MNHEGGSFHMKCMKQGMKPATKITQVSVPGRYGGVATPSIIHVVCSTHGSHVAATIEPGAGLQSSCNF